MIESFESEKLTRLIDNKLNYLKTLDPKSTHAMILQEEVMFLKNTILPIVLNETTILYSESQRYFTRKLTQAIENKCDVMACLIPITEIKDETILVGIANPREQTVFYDMENTDIDITISSVGDYRSKIKTLTLSLWED